MASIDGSTCLLTMCKETEVRTKQTAGAVNPQDV
jgi:hypothetical protein